MNTKEGKDRHDKRIEGLIVRAHSGIYSVKIDQQVIQCAIRGRLKKGVKLADPVCIGDRVKVYLDEKRANVIEEILPRKNVLGRSRLQKLPQLMAANLDLLVIMFAAQEPRLKPRLLDRFLIIAEQAGVPPVICINKMDLKGASEVKVDMAVYEQIRYPVLYTSVRTGQGLEDLRQHIENKTSALVGPSGVGKSALLNAIQPGLELAIAEVNVKTGKGRHTTSEARLLPLDTGGYIADTPGIRTLAFLDIEVENLDRFFPEMKPFLGTCRFTRCSHLHEPECEIKAAVERGEISRARYDSYGRLRTQEA